MQRRAQAQLQLQRLALPPGCWQRPAAGGIEQIPLMHQRSIHPQLHRISPPPQHQSRQAIPLLTLLPGHRAPQFELKRQPTPPARPDQQTAGMPIRAMRRSPGVKYRQITGTAWAGQAPLRPQIQPHLALKRFNPGANGALWALGHQFMRSRPIG